MVEATSRHAVLQLARISDTIEAGPRQRVTIAAKNYRLPSGKIPVRKLFAGAHSNWVSGNAWVTVHSRIFSNR
jgi:hypothetical protein